MCSALPTCGSGCNAPTPIPRPASRRVLRDRIRRLATVRVESYAWQVGSILADFLHRARARWPDWWTRSSRPPTGCPADERLRARQRAIGVILKTFFWALVLILVVSRRIAAAGWVRWPFALWTAV
jgi:hypothetical protein